MNHITTQIFSKEEMDAIHETTLKVLMDPGILVNNERARDIYRKAGCPVDDETKIVKIPKEIVDRMVAEVESTLNVKV